MAKSKIKKLWHSVNPAWRTEIISATQTFLAVFASTLAFSFESTGSVSLSTDALIAVLFAAARSGVKAVWVLIAKHLAEFGATKS